MLFLLLESSALSNGLDNQLFGDQLEEILNERKDHLLKNLFLKKSLSNFNKQYLAFKKKYKESTWSIKMISNAPNKSLLDVNIKSTRRIGDQIYNLHTKQTVKIETHKNKIKDYRIVDEESILNSQNSPLNVKLISPNQVLTGERYEVNLIIESPLDNSLTASGMIVIRDNEKKKISNDLFGIKPDKSGGLFKYIQAPIEPGSQTISAIITHPEGIYSITKKIKVGL